jgi:hypothetical protein
MSISFTLDDIREAADRQYAPVVIDLGEGDRCVMRQLLRLPQRTRDQVMEQLKLLETEEGVEADVEVTINAVTSVIKLVADDKGPKLIKALDGDIAMMMQVLERWMEATSVGEATPSDS